MVGRNSTLGHVGNLYGCAWFALKRTLLLCVSTLLLGLVSFAIQFQASRPAELASYISDFAKIQANFRLLDQPTKFSKSNNYGATIRIEEISTIDGTIRINAKGKLRGDAALRNFQSGASYSCLLSMSPAALGERAGFHARCNDVPRLISAPAGTTGLFESVRMAFMKELRGIDEDSAGLVAGLAIGDVSRLSSQLQGEMKLVSLTHLTAVSGANCAIVLAMFYVLVRKIGGGRWMRLTVGLTALTTYVLLVGSQPSVLRAAVMSGAVLVGISLGRKTAPSSALALSVIILLIADPWLAVDFGFALSVAATTGLLVLANPIASRLRNYFPSWLAIALAVSISAQIFCLPILLQLQTGLATYSLPANILAEPLVAPITILGLMSCATAWIIPPVAWCCTYLASVAAWVITRIAHFFANADNVTLGWPTGLLGALIASCVVLGFALWLKAEPNTLRNTGFVALSLIAAISCGSIGFNLVRNSQWPISDWSVVACDVGQGDALVVRSLGKVAVVDVGREDRPIDACLQKLGVRRIDLLVLTHFDMDHIGGLRGAIDGRHVALTLISPFKDERWGATGTNLVLSQAGIRTLAVEKNMTGLLGEFNWQVLAPNRNAEGSEDSNDASIVMLWRGPKFNLITMADLGEKGQMRIASDKGWWSASSIQSLPLIMKVSHHGSADQFGELIEALRPDLSLISVGLNNSYGHPTTRTLSLLSSVGSHIYRTDELGSIAVASRPGGLVISNAPRG